MTEAGKPNSPAIRAIVDFLGLGAFVVGFFVAGRWAILSDAHGLSIGAAHATSDKLISATVWLLVGSLAGLVVGFLTERRVAPMPLMAAVLAFIFGGLTLAFHDPRFIKIKPTAINLLFAIALVVGLRMKKNPLKALFGDSLKITEAGWRKLSYRYVVFFIAMAVLNEIVWRTQTDGVWVVFRFPGLIILSVLFSFTQTPMLMKDMKAAQAASELEI